MRTVSWVETSLSGISLLSSGSYSPNRNTSQKSNRKKNGTSKKAGNRVLMVGRLRELALYRVEVLSRAGFIVDAPETIEQAVDVLKRRQFDAIVLSYTLHSETVQRLTDLARETCPDCPVIAIADTNTLDRRITPDAVALANAGPSALIAALKQVMKSE